MSDYIVTKKEPCKQCEGRGCDTPFYFCDGYTRQEVDLETALIDMLKNNRRTARAIGQLTDRFPKLK